MSQVSVCPWCNKPTEHSDLGFVNGRHLFRCRVTPSVGSVGVIGCHRVWEEKTARERVKDDDPILKVLI